MTRSRQTDKERYVLLGLLKIFNIRKVQLLKAIPHSTRLKPEWNEESINLPAKETIFCHTGVIGRKGNLSRSIRTRQQVFERDETIFQHLSVVIVRYS